MSGPLPSPALQATPAPASAPWTGESFGELKSALRGARANGLDVAELVGDLDGATPADAPRLRRIALAYAHALAFGVVDPRQVHEAFGLETNRRDLEHELDAALSSGRLGAWFAGLAPQDADYHRLSEAYLAARGAAHAQPANARLALRARTLALNLERRRWLSRSPPGTRIDVNIATARLWFFKDGAMIDSRKVVVGAPDHETPLLQANFRRIVVNPVWYVPQAIARREILPKGPGYLARHDMKVVDGRVIQAPGPQSALGRVKFDLDDDQAIYLHDTPIQSAFERSNRDLSHGCIRVEDAVGFAHLVADIFGVGERLDDRLATDETGSVALGGEMPVRLLYETAYLDDGQVRFAADPYRWDDKLAQAMGMAEAGRKVAVAAAVAPDRRPIRG